jgi:trichothecene 3-O-acetyltransferase
MGSTIELRQPGPLGQLTFDSYTVICLGFRVDNDARDQATAALDAASIKLTAAFPWLAGQVIIQGRTDKQSGKYAIVPYPEQEGKSLVQRKDCTQLSPSYDQIIASKAPLSMLNSDILCSVSPMGYNMPQTVPWPVLLIEANYIDGGLILCFSSQHTGADMTGQGHIISYFAQALRNEPFDPADVKDGNQTPDISLLSQNEASHHLSTLKRPSQLHVKYPTPVPPRSAMPWKCYRITASKAAELKSLTQAYSTNDAITAFYTQTHTNARAGAGMIPPNEPIFLERATSIRPQCGYSSRYLGSCAGGASSVLMPNQNALSPTLANSLRNDLNAVDEHYARSFATALATSPDSTMYYYGATSRMGRDLVVSSWAKLAVSRSNFGELLGMPGFVRRPNFPPAPVTYVMPLTRDGDVDLAVCATPEEHAALMRDEEWRKWTEQIG